MITKGDIINDAYSRLRISGLTVDPSPEDVNVALMRLEDMASEWESDNVCVGYNFEEYSQEDPNADSGLERWAVNAFKANLAVRLLADFGKQPTQDLVAAANGSFASLQSRVVRINPTQYPNRQPIGSGNRRIQLQRYYAKPIQAPVDCDVFNILNGSNNEYVVGIGNDIDSETVTTYTKEVKGPITLLSDSYNPTDEQLEIRVRADNQGDAYIEFKVNTDAGNVYPVTVWFRVE